MAVFSSSSTSDPVLNSLFLEHKKSNVSLYRPQLADSQFAPTATEIKLVLLSTVQFNAVCNGGLRPCPTDTDLATVERTLRDLDLLFIGSNSDLNTGSRLVLLQPLQIDTRDESNSKVNDLKKDNKSETTKHDNNMYSIDKVKLFALFL